MPRFAPLALLFAPLLSACAVAPYTVPGPVSAPQSPDSARILVEAEVPPRLDERTMARNFVEVVGAVEPVAESVCRARAPQFNCDFRIVVDDRANQPPNAFQTLDASGRPVIAFTLALIAEARNRDELAFVLGHEASHHIAGHLDRQRVNATAGAAIFGQLATLTGGGAGAVRPAPDQGAAVGARSYSKSFELEADALGTRITQRAGYDPRRGAAFFTRIPDPGDRFLGTHPPNADRIATVERILAGG